MSPFAERLRSLRWMAVPIAAYLVITLALPIANGAAGRGDFVHACRVGARRLHRRGCRRARRWHARRAGSNQPVEEAMKSVTITLALGGLLVAGTAHADQCEWIGDGRGREGRRHPREEAEGHRVLRAVRRQGTRRTGRRGIGRGHALESDRRRLQDRARSTATPSTSRTRT